MQGTRGLRCRWRFDWWYGLWLGHVWVSRVVKAIENDGLRIGILRLCTQLGMRNLRLVEAVFVDWELFVSEALQPRSVTPTLSIGSPTELIDI